MHVKQTFLMLYETSTTGTGTVSFTTRTSRSVVWSVNANNIGNAFAFEYYIEDGNNKETGVGIFTPGTPATLTREIVYEKLENGTYTRFPATPLNLSGSARVGGHAGKMASGPFDIPAHPVSYNLPSTHMYIGDHVYPATDLIPTVFNNSYNDLFLNSVGHFVRFSVTSPVYIRSMSLEVTLANYTLTGLEDIQLQLRTGRDQYYYSVYNMLAKGSIDITSTGVKTVQLNGGDPFLLTPGIYAVGIAVVIDATSTDGATLPTEVSADTFRSSFKYKAVDSNVAFNNKSQRVEDAYQLIGAIGHDTPYYGFDHQVSGSWVPFITFGY